MLIPSKHREAMLKVLQKIYLDPVLRTNLGFKEGTAAMFYYGLPRLSVDLDFDLLDASKKEEVMERMKKVVKTMGRVDEAIEKKYTLFFMVSYEKGQHAVKIEISKRGNGAKFEPKNFMGMTLLVMNKEDMVARKMAALLERKQFAGRDAFDVCHFLKDGWEINVGLLEKTTGLTLSEVAKKSLEIVESKITAELLHGLGELIDNKQKAWVKEHLKEELGFWLRLKGNLSS